MDKELLNILYTDNKDVKRLYGEEVINTIKKAIRKYITKRTYEFNINDYYFNLDPHNLKVEYKTSDTDIVISNSDMHFETTKKTAKKYFVISKKNENEYDLTTPSIELVGVVSNNDGECSESYSFTVVNSEEDLKKHLQLLDGFQYEKTDNKNTVVIKRELTTNPESPNILLYFKSDSIRPVVKKDNKFINDKFVFKLDYNSFLPEMEYERNLISVLYSTIVEFYDDYINKI